MDEHKKFLADRLLSEERPVTYRLLSRALDVHVNTAKEMLYDFHKYQNGLKADSIHATYLISGTKALDNAQGDGDVEMTSSMPEGEALSDEVTTTTITLAREKDLNDILAGYQKVTSIHVYSLAPYPQKDLSLLCDVTTQLSEFSKKNDPTAAAKKYGTIINTQVRRRDRKGRGAIPVQISARDVKQEAPKPTPAANVKEEPAAPTPSPFAPKPKPEASESPSKEATPSSSNNSKKPAPALKRGASGGIMAAFATAAAKPPKPKPAPKKEDTAMALSDDGEADDDDMPVSKKPPVDAEAVRRLKKEREEELRKMMEEDDDEEEVSEKEDEPVDEEMEEAPEPEPEPEVEPKKEEPAEVVSSAGDGRRRGKRRVMKKERILDDQGYMVTIQKPGWESFSEDEAPPPAKKLTPTPTPSSSAPKAKKAAGKSSQGNIMSFFSKK
ncbi:Fc.00g085760.m01.CDS01 [Cosmosporella sp. VM-42]